MLCLSDKQMQQAGALETAYPMSYPWNDDRKEDVPRFFRQSDGWWKNPVAPENGKALISCTGDLICEPRLIRANRYGDTVFFHPLFQFARPILRQSDLVLGNLETTVSDTTPDAGKFHTVAGKYHCNTTESFLDALRYAGFDGVVNANNHDCDSGALGLIETLERLDKHGFFHTGTFLPGETDRATLVNVGGIRVGILSYTHRFNKLETNFTPLGQKMLNQFSQEKVHADIAWAKERGAEFILCYMHWGKEYMHYPIDEQLEKAQILADEGADYIIGSHSHCLQVNDTVTAKSGKCVPVVYSMGNFITNEQKDMCHHSGILQLLLEKTDGGIQVTSWFAPCFIFEEFHSARYGCVPADTLHNGGYYHPDLPRTREFSGQLISLPNPTSAAITAKELCKLFGIPEVDYDFAISGICTSAPHVLDRQLYFWLGDDSNYHTLCLRRRRPVLVVGTKAHPEQPTLVVPDVKKAYRQLTSHLRSRFDSRFVVVAGAENKTVTAQFIARMLESVHRVHSGTADHGWIFQHPSHSYCVQELRSGPVGYQALKPTLCVITSYIDDLPQLLDALAENAQILYNGTDPQLEAALQGKGKPFFPAPWSGLRLEVPAGAARAVADLLQIPALDSYSYSGMEQNIFHINGMTVLTDYNCKSEHSAKASLAVLAAQTGKKIAVVAERYAPFARADVVIPLPAPSPERPERFAAELRLEEALLSHLEPGCTVLLCGDRSLELNVTLRRVFGLTDGNIYDVT